MYSKCRWVCCFIEKIWRNLALHHLLTMDHLQWMGAVRMRVQTPQWSTSNHHQNPFTYLFRTVFVVNSAWSVHISLAIQARWIFDWRNQHYGLIFKPDETVFMMIKMFLLWICLLQICSFSFQMTLIDGLESLNNLWNIIMYIIIFLASHSDGTHSLHKIHQWANNAQLRYIAQNLFWWRKLFAS